MAAAMLHVASPPMQGPGVTDLQKRLTALGYAPARSTARTDLPPLQLCVLSSETTSSRWMASWARQHAKRSAERRPRRRISR